ncbi:MAG: copper amine oxidase N-terminal domain-containing protein [Clostridiales bacterium]|jgi:hypothetical protein|nr:copper amine oxidase N-terminal domain-containing protein [Clostridiales bacterium]
MRFFKKLCAAALLLAVLAGSAIFAHGQAFDEYGRVFMPVRATFEGMGFDVGWDDATRQVTLVRGADALALAIEVDEFTVNGEIRSLLEPARLIGGITFAPIRPLLHAAGYTLGENGEILPHFTLGIPAQEPLPASLEEFIPTLAIHIQRYNQLTADFWPNVANNVFLAIDNRDTGQLWMILPDGEFFLMSDAQIEALGAQRAQFDEGWQELTWNGLRGLYYATTEHEVTDRERIYRMVHVGTYEGIANFTHYVMHILEQPNWVISSEIYEHNSDRLEYLEETEARAVRWLMQRQMLLALANPGDERLLLDVAATIGRWLSEFPQDALNALAMDRIEGTAEYFEMVASLAAAYPGQIYSRADVDRAMSELAHWHFENATVFGVVSESYMIGAYAGMLLTRIAPGWQNALINDGRATAITLFYEHFSGIALPAPVQLTEAEMLYIAEELGRQMFSIFEAQFELIPEWIADLPNLDAELREAYLGIIEDFLAEMEANVLPMPYSQILEDFVRETRAILANI